MARKAQAMAVTNERKAELLTLAKDILADRVMTDRHCRDANEFSHVFMLFLFVTDMNRLRRAGLIYEYIDKAAPMSCNGKPIFFSARYLNKSDAKFVDAKIRELRQAIDSVKP